MSLDFRSKPKRTKSEVKTAVRDAKRLIDAGLTVEKACKKLGLSANSYYRYAKKIRKTRTQSVVAIAKEENFGAELPTLEDMQNRNLKYQNEKMRDYIVNHILGF